jgi:hypothetical protein
MGAKWPWIQLQKLLTGLIDQDWDQHLDQLHMLQQKRYAQRVLVLYTLILNHLIHSAVSLIDHLELSARRSDILFQAPLLHYNMPLSVTAEGRH